MSATENAYVIDTVRAPLEVSPEVKLVDRRPINGTFAVVLPSGMAHAYPTEYDARRSMYWPGSRACTREIPPSTDRTWFRVLRSQTYHAQGERWIDRGRTLCGLKLPAAYIWTGECRPSTACKKCEKLDR